MACVETAIPVPNSRKKTDELFLYWLSEPSTQELLRKELVKISGVPFSETDDKKLQEGKISGNLLAPLAAVTNVLRPGSPNMRTPSPPLLSHRSPKSPRGAGRNTSPKKSSKSPLIGKSNLCNSSNGYQQQHGVEETDGADDFMFHNHVHRSEVSRTIGGIENLVGGGGGSYRHERGSRSRSHSPKPESLPTGPSGSNHIPKPEGTNLSSSQIPRFYFPNGKPKPEENLSERFAEMGKLFRSFDGGEAGLQDFAEIAKVLHISHYWKGPLFKACIGKDKERKTVTYHAVKKTWQRITHNCHDESSRFIRLLATNGRNYLVEEDFEFLVQDIVDSHPGLQFLGSTPEFHARYIETVIGRIFYMVDRNWNGRISAAEIRRSNFLKVLSQLEEESDINQVTNYFSYEHFYVIYCKFWELDTDHDLEIDTQDLVRYADQALTQRIVQRVMSGVVSRKPKEKSKCNTTRQQRMGYKDFIWFILSEEDKNSPKSIEYWFRCMDLDGDGVLSLFEMVYFYEEVLQRLQQLNIDCLSIENTICQILDMVNPREKGKITLRDLKSSQMMAVFFNTFMNIEKYLDYEQRDPVSTAKEEEELQGAVSSDWDKFASEQYETLLQEEQYDQDNEFEETEGSDLEEDEKEMLDLLK